MKKLIAFICISLLLSCSDNACDCPPIEPVDIPPSELEIMQYILGEPESSMYYLYGYPDTIIGLPVDVGRKFVYRANKAIYDQDSLRAYPMKRSRIFYSDPYENLINCEIVEYGIESEWFSAK